MKKYNQKGFTLIEILFTVVIIGTIISISVPAINSSLTNGKEARESANVQSLNQAAERARIKGITGPGTYGSNKIAALNWYKTQRLLNNPDEINLNGIYYYTGLWERNNLPDDPQDVLALLSIRQSTPEEDIAAMLLNTGASTPEQLAEWYGFSTGDFAGFMSGYGASTKDELGQMFGYNDYNEWVYNWWGYDPGESQIASDMGYTIPNSGNPENMAMAYGYATFQDLATSWYGGVTIPTLTNQQIAELSTRIGEYGPEVTAALIANPSTVQPNSLVLIQNGIAAAIANGDTATWTTSQVQEPLFAILQNSANNWNNNGELLSQMDFSALDLTNESLNNMKLQGSNLTGAQINQATEVRNINVSGLDLTGFDPTGKNLQNTNFTNTTGITAGQILQASNYTNTNLTGMDFTDTSFSGKILQGITISNPQNFNGTMLNGATNVSGAKFVGVDLTGWTIPNVANQTISSLAGSTLSQTQKNALFGNTGSSGYVTRQTNLQGVDLSGTIIRNDSFLTNYTGVTGLTGANFQNNGFTETWLPIDMTGYNWNGKALRGTNLTGATGFTGTDLNGLTNASGMWWGVNLSNHDLTGWQPTYNISKANLQNVTGITATSLINATNINNLNLRGTGIKKSDLDAALVQAGKNPTLGNYNTGSIAFDPVP